MKMKKLDSHFPETKVGLSIYWLDFQYSALYKRNIITTL